MDASSLLDKVYELLTVYGIKVVAAVAIFIVGRWVAKAITNFIKKIMTKSDTDETLGTLRPGGGSSQSEEGTVGGVILNFGLGYRFNEQFDLRAQVPTFFISAGDQRDGAVVPTFMATAGISF